MSAANPITGERWRHKETGEVITVLSGNQDKYGDIIIRDQGGRTKMDVANLLHAFELIPTGAGRKGPT